MFKRLFQVAALVTVPIVVSSAAVAGGCRHGECYEKVHTPDVYGVAHRPVVVAPARTEVVHSPAVYGTVSRAVEVAPARAWHTYTPAVYGTVHKDVVVHPGGYRWQHTVDAFGRERLCKVYVPAVTRTVAERVLVQPSERVTHVAPALYREVHQKVVLQPASTHKIHHPAVIAHEPYPYLVRRGGYHWQRSW